MKSDSLQSRSLSRGGTARVLMVGLFWACEASALAADYVAGSIPGAVSHPPEWLLEGAPFDVKAFFAAVPDDQNAAPLYLDALFEFSAEVLPCFPPGPQRDQRAQLARDRAKRLGDIMTKLHNDPNSVPDSEIDSLMADYGLGFQKIYQAQVRPKCVFATGLGIDALLPHAQACRQVAVVAELRVRAWLKRGNIDAALADTGVVLRMIRDLQPRGGMITQLVCGAITNVTAVHLAVPILNAPGLTADQCDRLIKLLAEHDRLALDAFAEGVRSDYLTLRMAQVQLVEHQAEVRKALGVPPDKSLTELLLPADATSGLQPGLQLDAALAKTPSSVRKRAAEALVATCRGRLALAERTVIDQRASHAELDKGFAGSEPLVQITRGMLVSYDVVSFACGRMRALLREAECLAVLKRSELKHKKPSTDLAKACKDAGLSSVPLDPFNGKPLHAANVDGVLVVYSVGADGKDDGGAKESRTDKDAGDIILSIKQKPY